VRRLIDYNVFSTQYWKSPYNGHKKGPEPDLVLAEILGVIKGSTSTKRDFRPLSRDEYVGMSSRKAHVFTDENSRNAVYDMYQRYERQKGLFGDGDDIDRAIHLLTSFEKDPNLKTRVQALLDEVYVDGRLQPIKYLYSLLSTNMNAIYRGTG